MFDPVLFAALSGKRFSPLSLFASGEQGAWYDPSDFSTMFQDNAGTTPVTAVEQPVGLIQDKSGRGNHASQSTAASRPVLSARVNQLTFSEQFDNAAWTPTGVTITANSSVAPNGTTTADSCLTTTTTPSMFQTVAAPSTNVTYRVHAKIGAGVTKPTLEFLVRNHTTATNFDIGVFDTVTGAITGTGWTSTAVGSDWYRVSYTRSSGITAGDSLRVYSGWTGGTTTSGQTWIVWGADLRVTNDGVGLPAYQRVAAATDYDTSGFPLYLAFDGTDDSLATASIDFSATDKVGVFAGIRRLADGGIPIELSAATFANNGVFSVYAGAAASATGANWTFNSKGTSTPVPPCESTASYGAPLTNVLTGIGDISSPSCVLRVNGSQVASTSATQGTGNLGNYPLYIGRRGGTTLPFNGRIYSLIVRGALSTDAQIEATERWVNNVTGAY